MRSQLDDMSDQISMISRQIESAKEFSSYEAGLSESRYRELLDYLMTMKLLSEQRHSSVKGVLYAVLGILCVIAFKIA